MSANVTVIEESSTGLNKKLNVNGQGMTNNQAYNQARKGNIEGYIGVMNSRGTKFIKSVPGGNKNNNLN